jgi:hypothetical protein
MVDHRVVDFARRIVSIVAGKQMTAAQFGTDLLDRFCVEPHTSTSGRRNFDIRHGTTPLSIIS